MLNKIYNETVREIVSKMLDKYSDSNKRIYGNNVLFWCEKLLEKRGILNDNVQQVFVDLIYAAALTCNIFIDDEKSDNKYYDVFKARMILSKDEDFISIPEEYRNSYFQLIEAQYGEKTPVPQVRPNPDTPQSTLADAKFIVDSLPSYINFINEKS